MYATMLVWRPTAAARKAHRSASLPREVHVHADGSAVACYTGRADVHFPTIYGVLDEHGLTQADLEPVGGGS